MDEKEWIKKTKTEKWLAKNKRVIKPFQHRKTFDDTCRYQEELRVLIQSKIDKNKGMSIEESDRARFVFPRAILSYAINAFQFQNKDGRITIFRHLSTFFSQIIKLRVGHNMLLTDVQSGQKYQVEIRELWVVLLDELEYYYPFARNEALHISPEIPIFEGSTSYDFSADVEAPQEETPNFKAG